MTKEELIKEAKSCKSVEELKELTSKNGYELTDEELSTFFSNSKEISDEELDNVSGGAACDKSGATPLFKVGDIVKWEQTGYKAKIEWVSSDKGTFEYNALWDRKAFYYTIRPYTNYGYDQPWDQTRESIPEYKLSKM